MSTTRPVLNTGAYSPASSTQRQRRLARVRLAEIVALRRAARSSAQPPSKADSSDVRAG